MSPRASSTRTSSTATTSSPTSSSPVSRTGCSSGPLAAIKPPMGRPRRPPAISRRPMRHRTRPRSASPAWRSRSSDSTLIVRPSQTSMPDCAGIARYTAACWRRSATALNRASRSGAPANRCRAGPRLERGRAPHRPLPSCPSWSLSRPSTRSRMRTRTTGHRPARRHPVRTPLPHPGGPGALARQAQAAPSAARGDPLRRPLRHQPPAGLR
jgi:hypothetical protein